jgi:5-methylcytosine-specific restriction endonuclease McrBC regulatory subunit McrC
VGALKAPGLDLVIEPKERSFFEAIQKLALDFTGRSVNEFEAVVVAGGEELGERFLIELVRVLDDGAPWRYSSEILATSYPRGRLDVRQTVGKLLSRGISHRVVARQTIKQQQREFAALVHGAFRTLIALGGTSRLTLNRIEALIHVLQPHEEGHADEPVFSAARLLADGDLTESGRTLVKLCLAILGYGDAEGARIIPVPAGFAAFHDLETLWEGAVAQLAQHAELLSISPVVELHGLARANLRLFTDGGPLLDPDIILRSGEVIRGVIDAKYKFSEPAGAPPAADVYQITAYVERTGASFGLLVYFGNSDGLNYIGTTASGSPVIKATISSQRLSELGSDTLKALLHDQPVLAEELHD